MEDKIIVASRASLMDYVKSLNRTIETHNVLIVSLFYNSVHQIKRHTGAQK